MITAKTSKTKRTRGGFSLIEVTVVLAIMASLAAVALPLTLGVLRSNHLGSAAAQLSGLIEEARSKALARQSYVWLAFKADEAGGGMWVLLFESGKTANTDQGDVRLLNKPVLLKGVDFKKVSEMGVDEIPESQGDHSMDISDAAADPEAVAFSPVEFKLGGLGQATFSQLIQFSPRGEALARKGVLPKWIFIGLTGQKDQGKNNAVFQISGLTAQCIMHRP